MQMKQNLKYFIHSRSYFRFILLKKLDEDQGIILPIQSQDGELLNAMSIVHIQNLIEEKLAEKIITKGSTEILKITDKGKSQLKREFIDYQLDLLTLEQSLGNYFSGKINKIKGKNVHQLALYGASDTAQSIINYLVNNGFNISCIIDDDIKKQNNEFHGFPIVSRDNISSYNFDTIIITTVEYHHEVKSKIDQSFSSKYQIISLFED